MAVRTHPHGPVRQASAQHAGSPRPGLARSTDESRGRDALPIDAAGFARLLAALTDIPGLLPPALLERVEAVFYALGPPDSDADQVRSRFYGRLNQKLMASREVLREIYAFAAGQGLVFNYPAKAAIAWSVDSGDEEAYAQLVGHHAQHGSALAAGLIERFRPMPHSVTRQLLLDETIKPTKLRKSLEREVAQDVYEAAAGPLVWSLWPSKALWAFFGPETGHGGQIGDHLTDLRGHNPDLFDRGRALVVRFVAPDEGAPALLRDHLAGWVAEEYVRINNYGYLAIVFDCGHKPGVCWELSADLTMFAERFDERPVESPYFRSDEVARETLEYVPGLDRDRARFDLVNEGFTFRDLFVLTDGSGRVERLLLLFQKNQRDETKVPCPGCRTSDVAGNSYPTLGVKSWECRNPLCPDRSTYNRGKRYSFKALLAQAAIEHPENQIPTASVRRWQRDVVKFEGDPEVLDMLGRHYSMAGDTVVVIDAPADTPLMPAGRRLLSETGSSAAADAPLWRGGAFVARYTPTKEQDRTGGSLGHRGQFGAGARWEIRHGDALRVLSEIRDDTFERAVTSPPYFNARDYAQWHNLYCYLHDMWRINSEVFRTLKPGGVYAYNIFDYFDNERTVVFSDMGRKRIPLSALMVDVFRRIGFEFVRSIVWDKGEIHGKRGFNAGNFSPFYQSPFNCWEHILLVRKPAPATSAVPPPIATRDVLELHPVVKMVRGVNTLGHTAPFPIGLPEAMLRGLPTGSAVLDPFGGSGTTARAALNLGLRAVLVERDADYVELSRRLTRDHELAIDSQQPQLW